MRAELYADINSGDLGNEVVLPRIIADAILRWEDNDFVLSSPRNAIDLGLNELSFKALFYFDGHTTHREAIERLRLSSGAPLSHLSQALSDLVVLLQRFAFFEGDRNVSSSHDDIAL
jgi:hypothetical protein